MARSKTSVYLDRRIWDRFRRCARRRGVGVSRILEGMIDEEVADELLDSLLSGAASVESYELEFEPVRVRGERVSGLVREMRNERSGNVSGQ